MDYDLMAAPIEVERLFNRIRNIEPRESKQYPGKWSFYFEGNRYEIDSTENASRHMLGAFKDNFVAGSVNLPIDAGVYYIKPSTCYVFKRSHAGTPVHVDKTLSDLIFLSDYFMGSELVENNYEFLNSFELVLLKELTKEAEARDQKRKARITSKIKYAAYCAWVKARGNTPLPYDSKWWDGWKEFISNNPNWRDEEWRKAEAEAIKAFQVESGYIKESE